MRLIILLYARYSNISIQNCSFIERLFCEHFVVLFIQVVIRLPSFAERLKQLRQERGLTQEQLAEKTDIPAASIRRLEVSSISSLPRKERLVLLSNFFNVSIDYLVGNSDERFEKRTRHSTDEEIRESSVNTSRLPLLEQIFFDGFLEASNEEKEEIIRYWHEEVKKRKKTPPAEKDNSPSAWDLKDE